MILASMVVMSVWRRDRASATTLSFPFLYLIDLRKVGFYDPITNQTYLNLPAILDFLKKGAQPTRTVHDISKKAGIFTELSLNKTKLN